MRKVQFATDNFYHIYNRGVEKRVVFTNQSDYLRFLLCLAEFNTTDPVDLKLISNPRLSLENIQGLALERPKKKPIVKIHAFCLMPNHFHLLLEPLIDNGISIFMHKLSTGYTMYFNKKYERVGSLFQGPFKACLIDDEVYLTHLLRYIHLNPVDLVEPDWEVNGIKDWTKIIKFLDSYKWSSFHDYNGKSTYPEIVSTEFMLDILGGVEAHRDFIKSWLISDLTKIEDIALDFKA